MKLIPDRVLAWRLRRQFLGGPGAASAAAVTERLCGVQAQVASSAEHASWSASGPAIRAMPHTAGQ